MGRKEGRKEEGGREEKGEGERKGRRGNEATFLLMGVSEAAE